MQPEDDAAAVNRNQLSQAPRIRSVSKIAAHDSRAPTIGACRAACTRPSTTMNGLERCVTARAALCATKRFYDIVTMTDDLSDLHLTTRTARCSGCSDTASSCIVESTESEALGSTARRKLLAVMLKSSSWQIRYFLMFCQCLFSLSALRGL